MGIGHGAVKSQFGVLVALRHSKGGAIVSAPYPTALKDGKLCNNDIVLMRYADVLLMRAEALERNGQDGSAYFNAVRDRVKAAPRECNLDNILKERMLELAWEGWRRNDLIRYRLFTRAY